MDAPVRAQKVLDDSKAALAQAQAAYDAQFQIVSDLTTKLNLTQVALAGAVTDSTRGTGTEMT